MKQSTWPLKIMIAATLVFVFGVNPLLRLYSMPQQFPSEPFSVLGAIRMFYLPLFNLGADTWDNFFKAWFATSHGWNDFIYFYIVTALFNILRIPLSEVHYYYALHVLGTLYLISAFFMTRVIFDFKTACIATIFLAVSYFAVHAPNCINHILITMFLQSLLFLSVALYLRKKESLPRRIFFAALLCLAASLELILFLPSVLLLELMWQFSQRKEQLGLAKAVKNITRKEHFGLWIPAAISGLATFGIFLFFGYSRLGMWAYQKHAFPITPKNLHNFLNIRKLLMFLNMRLSLGPDYLAILLFFCIALFIVLLCLRKIRWHNPIFFFILAFFTACVSNIATNRWKFYTANLPMCVITAYGFGWLLERFKDNKKALSGVVSILAATIVVFTSQQFQHQQARKKEIAYYFRPSPLKTVGYYIREYGPEESTVFNLFKNVVFFDQSEYYYGKYIMSDGMYAKRNFSLSDYTPEEALQKYPQIGQFDFYVTLESEPKAKALREEGSLADLRKVADIYDQEKLLACVFSPHVFPYVAMQLSDYNERWDLKFANLKHLFKNGRFGLSSLIGNRE
ncbi:MAG: hypothetical protein V1727_02070 [Candidatus Omnitrophota bacterium]